MLKELAKRYLRTIEMKKRSVKIVLPWTLVVQSVYMSRIQGCHGRENILENKKNPGQGKVREFHFQSGKSRKNEKKSWKSQGKSKFSP